MAAATHRWLCSRKKAALALSLCRWPSCIAALPALARVSSHFDASANNLKHLRTTPALQLRCVVHRRATSLLCFELLQIESLRLLQGALGL